LGQIPGNATTVEGLQRKLGPFTLLGAFQRDRRQLIAGAINSTLGKYFR